MILDFGLKDNAPLVILSDAETGARDTIENSIALINLKSKI
jgi:hypothetical protein